MSTDPTDNLDGVRRNGRDAEDRAMPRDLVRDDVVLSARTWVVKVGTSVLTAPDGTLDPGRIGHLAEQICAILDTGRKVALVSSGAVGAGLGRLGLRQRPDSLPQLQA
jgi:glutamate 5-kinase